MARLNLRSVPRMLVRGPAVASPVWPQPRLVDMPLRPRSAAPAPILRGAAPHPPQIGPHRTHDGCCTSIALASTRTQSLRDFMRLQRVVGIELAWVAGLVWGGYVAFVNDPHLPLGDASK